MPTYKVTDPNTGRTLRLTGDTPPTEDELNDIFSKIGTEKPQRMFSSEEEGRVALEKQKAEQSRLESEAKNPHLTAIKQSAARAGENIGTAATKTWQTAGKAGSEALLGIPGIVSQLSTGGKPTGSLNPFNLVEGGTNIFEGKNLTEQEKMMASGAGMIVPVGAGMKVAGNLIAKTPLYQAANSYVNMGKTLTNMRDLYGKTAEGMKVPMSRLADHIGEAVTKTKDKLASFKKSIDDEIFTEAEKQASVVHSKLPSFFRNASTEYGKRLDEIAQFADDSAPVNRQQLNELIDNIQADAKNHQLDIGSVYKKLSDLKNKYQMQEQVGEAVIDKSMEVVPFKEVNAVFREAMKKTSGAFKSGSRVMPEDVVGMITKEHYGSFLENKVAPEVAEALKTLNGQYKPIAQARKELGRIFKPYSEYQEGAGSSLLAKVAESTARKDLLAGQEKLLNVLEQGNELTSGIGDVTSTIRGLGAKKVNVTKELQDTVDDLVVKKGIVEDYQATRADMQKKVGWALKVLGLGSVGTGAVIITNK